MTNYLRAILRGAVGLWLFACAVAPQGQAGAQAVLPAASAGSGQAFECTIVTEIPQSECAAIVALYHSTDGANWSAKTGWLVTDTPCSWYGIACADGHVSRLNLRRNTLNGFLPDELSHLTALRLLDLGLNYRLAGDIPPALGELTALQYLDLAMNRFDGEIPAEFGKLVDLQFLYLHRNRLTGHIPVQLGSLYSVQSLYLNHNQLTGPIPPELSNLSALRYLDLSENQLSGPIPPELGRLTNLGDLYLNDNQLSGPIPAELGNLTNIRARWDWSNQEDGMLRPPPPLGYLWLSNNRLSGPVPRELGRLDAAAGIDLSCNQLDGDLPPEVGLAIQRTYMGDVFYNKLTGYDPLLYPVWYWYDSQTVPPTNLQAAARNGTVTLFWTPIAYSGDGGFYEISYASTPGGPFVVHGQTADKTVSSYTLTDLTPDATTYFRMRTFTPAHDGYWCHQQNDLSSDYTPLVRVGGGTENSTPTATPTRMPAATTTATPTATPTATATPVRVWLPLVWR